MTLKDWKARRAGGRITITGTDASTGEPAKIVGVDYIEPTRHGGCVAIDKEEVVHDLLCAAPSTRGSIPRSHRVEGHNYVD